MKKFRYTFLTIIISFSLMALFSIFNGKKSLKVYTKKITHPKIEKPIHLESLPPQKSRKISRHTLKQSQFTELDTWKEIDVSQSLQAFQQSCQLWVKLNPKHSIGNSQIPMSVKDWLPICNQALKLPNQVSSSQARLFFEKYFRPFHWKNYHKGKFTGYYSPTFKGSSEKTTEYKTPLYGLPKDFVTADVRTHRKRKRHHLSGHVVRHRLKPYFTRSEIYNGAIKGKAKIIAWLKSPLDAMLLEIEGSGVIETEKGEQIFVGYAGENGRRYKSIAQLLINNHILKRANASVTAIKQYFAKHPGQMRRYVGLNPSYVFFSRYKKADFKGAQNVVLTPKFSLAVDRRFIPLGIPLFLKTKYPVNTAGETEKLSRLMIAQDTGGAIRGPIRGDIYWGTGHKAMQIASLMSHEGDYWFLLPKHYHLS